MSMMEVISFVAAQDCSTAQDQALQPSRPSSVASFEFGLCVLKQLHRIIVAQWQNKKNFKMSFKISFSNLT
jgi:hypothetical protein